MELFLVSLLNGLVHGMLLFILASGLTLIFSIMGVLNFAHASLYMLGAYFAYEISRRLGFWVALAAAPLLCGLLGALIEGRLVKAEGVQSVAELPTLDALRAQIVGLLSAPAAQLSMVLSEASGGKLKRTLEGFKKSLEEPEGQAQDGQAPPS